MLCIYVHTYVILLIGKQTSNEKKTIKVITSDLIREIRCVDVITHAWKLSTLFRVPSTPDPSGFSVVMEPKEFARIKVWSSIEHRFWENFSTRVLFLPLSSVDLFLSMYICTWPRTQTNIFIKLLWYLNILLRA